MDLHRLGSTDLLVTPIGLGLAALGRPGYINLGHSQDLNQEYNLPAMKMHAHQVLDEAWHLGVRYFDAARSYGRAEEFLGSWLASRNISPESVTVGSKWGYTYTAGWKVHAEKHEVKEHSLAVLKRQWRESRANLGEYLRLYQIHSATLQSGVLENNEVLHELARLKNEEKVAIGLTLSGANQAEVLRTALDIKVEGARLFDCVQATWNLLETSTTQALESAHIEGMGILIKEALANGRLTPRNHQEEFRAKYTILERQAARFGATVDALSLAAVLAQPWADIVLSGAATVEQIRSNIKALDVHLDQEAQGVLMNFAEPPEVYWEIRSNLAWN